MASGADIHSTFTNICLTSDFQNEAAVYYLDGYIAVIRKPDLSRASYRDIPTQITHDNLILRIYLTSQQFRTRRVSALAKTRDCLNALHVFCDCCKLRQTTASVPSNGRNASRNRSSSIFTNENAVS